MNERIEKLAEQAGCKWWEGRAMRDMTRCQADLENFAELIVRECIQSIQNESLDSGDEWELGLRIAENAIKKHFGVKE